MNPSTPAPTDLASAWAALWPQALAAWSPYVLLRPPTFYDGDAEAQPTGMAGQIAAIRLTDQSVMVNLETIHRLGLEGHGLAVLAHEIGHHVYVPGNLTDNARMLAAMQPMLAGLSSDTPAMVANLYGDLHLNDRLQRRHGVDVAAVYRRLREAASDDTSQTWKVYTRAYEHLWRLAPGTLGPPGLTPEMNADALLIARLIRHFSANWLAGARRFAAILYPYLQEDQQKGRQQTFVRLGLGDCKNCSGGMVPDGLATIDPGELGDGGEFDRELEGAGAGGGEGEGEEDEGPEKNAGGKQSRKEALDRANTVPTKEGRGAPGQQYRDPFSYGQLLKALGLDLDRHAVTTRYYRERALPHLLPFPAGKAPQAKEPLPEGYETWEPGEELEQLDLVGSLVRSPVPVPGVTTVQRVYGEVPGTDPAKVPMDLDIYVDCSGSMPDPEANLSYLALAGTILALSALRAGARVQATLWSDAGRFETTAGFIRDEKRILGVITGYISGGTAFPLNVLRDTYADWKKSAPPVHIVVISDDGVDTILQNDEKGTHGADIAVRALEQARGGGTLVLNLPDPDNWKPRTTLEALGFRVHAVRDWADLVGFARAFVRENYE
jgi:hypothetical protein